MPEFYYSKWPRAPTTPAGKSQYITRNGEERFMTQDEGNVQWLRDRMAAVETEFQDLSAQRAHIDLLMSERQEVLDALRVVLAEVSLPVSDGRFLLAIAKSYRERGRFNVPADVAPLLADDGDVAIFLYGEDEFQEVGGAIRRYETRNGQPTIQGGRVLKEYFERRAPGEKVEVQIRGPREIDMTPVQADASG